MSAPPDSVYLLSHWCHLLIDSYVAVRKKKNAADWIRVWGL